MACKHCDTKGLRPQSSGPAFFRAARIIAQSVKLSAVVGDLPSPLGVLGAPLLGVPRGDATRYTPAMFFTFDGIDGVGKSTQITLFCDWLRSQGRTVVECRDPGSTPLGERVRDILLHAGEDTPIDARSEMLLYMAARAQLVEEVVRPAVERGDAVVSDRFLLANIAYQGWAGGLGAEVVKQVGAVAVDGFYPDCTFLLDLSPADADARMEGPRDRMESRGEDYRRRLRDGFLQEATAAPQRIHVIDASQSIEEVHQAIQAAASKAMNR